MSKLEEVTRAICAADGTPACDHLCAPCQDAAKAAIAAMREPTDEMVSAGEMAVPVFGAEDEVEFIWTTMIDAVLEGG